MFNTEKYTWQNMPPPVHCANSIYTQINLSQLLGDSKFYNRDVLGFSNSLSVLSIFKKFLPPHLLTFPLFT